ncbi:MAG: hypothetical protein V3V49_13945 [Candidatus Krumholzibacteria bacterium]
MQPQKSLQAIPLGDEISDNSVRQMFHRFVELLSGIDGRVRLQTSRVEVRFFLGDEFLCRLAPYRELFHVQIGDAPAWEARVRTHDGYAAAVDRVLQRYLEVYASAASHG